MKHIKQFILISILILITLQKDFPSYDFAVSNESDIYTLIGNDNSDVLKQASLHAFTSFTSQQNPDLISPFDLLLLQKYLDGYNKLPFEILDIPDDFQSQIKPSINQNTFKYLYQKTLELVLNKLQNPSYEEDQILETNMQIVLLIDQLKLLIGQQRPSFVIYQDTQQKYHPSNKSLKQFLSQEMEMLYNDLIESFYFHMIKVQKKEEEKEQVQEYFQAISYLSGQLLLPPPNLSLFDETQEPVDRQFFLQISRQYFEYALQQSDSYLKQYPYPEDSLQQTDKKFLEKEP